MINQQNPPSFLVSLPPDQEQQIYSIFLDLAKKAVEEATKKALTNSRYFNQKQLCEYFTCGPAQIREWQALGLKSFHKGKEIMFDINDVHEFLNDLKY
ncbi:hypothetical protein [Eremococcus coleocola]|uniref:hypothetical protein n=1 Tax=Eremococcus coleocola TaxID=88132 RepID=UPI00041A5B36|nr:hypothetical protein [Eremococcus coleocola]